MHRLDRTSLSLLLLLVIAIVWAAPQSVLDPDALSRLAMGRHLADNGGFPAHDLWTFSAPSVPFGDPEWLGDLAWYAAFSHFSEAGLQVMAVALASLGYLLALGFGVACGGSVRTIVPLLLCTLPVAAPRINARNDLHLLWLFPLLGLLLMRAQVRAVYWIAVIALLWLWANVHSSFVIAALPILAVAIAQRSSKSVWPWVTLLVLPVLPVLGLSGASAYRQLLDHLIGADLYRTWLSEWRTPLTSGGWLAILPLHVVCALGAYALRVARREQQRWLRLTMFILGSALAYSSRRFLPLMAALIIPAIAPELSMLLERVRRTRPRVLAGLCVAVLAYLALTARSILHREQTSVFAWADQPAEAIQFIVEHAPGSRVFNSFDDGPWLLWFGRERLQHYIDPRNNLGHAALQHYVEVRKDTIAFEAEAERLGMTMALIPYRDASLRPLAMALANSKRWCLVYWNGWQALFASRTAINERLIELAGYRVLRPTLDLGYLAARDESAQDLARDLSLLETQSYSHASVIRAYRQLRDAAAGAPSAAAAARTIKAAWPALPDTEGLTHALEALARNVTIAGVAKQ